MDRRDFMKKTGLAAAAAAVAFGGCIKEIGTGSGIRGHTNFVIIMTDDQGYGDVGCYGAEKFKTANIDKLASQGMRFTDFHVAQPVCSASRAALLTGCYSNRISILGALHPRHNHGINPEEETIAEVLKKKGYTCGIFGKWHLGHHKPFLPLQHGFDEYFGLPYSNDMWPVNYDGTPNENSEYPILPLIEGNEKIEEIKTIEDQDPLTIRYTEKAVDFIFRNKSKPFFLYLAHSMPHVPLAISDRYRGRKKKGMYGKVMSDIDYSVKQILRALDKYSLNDKTFVIFISDNGPWLTYGNHAGSAGPLREGKMTIWEGGTRVPCIMRWPKYIKKGTVCDKLVTSMDILPTFAGIADAPLPKNKIDGVNIFELLKGNPNANPRDTFYYYYGEGLNAVRQGKWKLVLPHTYNSYEAGLPGNDGFPGETVQQKAEQALYDLQADIGERNNVADKYPEIVQKLKNIAEQARQDLGDSNTGQKGQNIRPAGKLDNTI